MLRRFERQSLVYDLTIGGHTIGTTSEHPFFVRGKGWTPAKELQPGDAVRLLTPGWQRVDSNVDTGRSETVYNLEIEGDHTYFVGDLTWGWQVWAHNRSCAEIGTTAEKAARQALINRGHKIVGSIQNNSGHGIDLITRKGGKLFFWEVKGSTVGRMHLSPDQAKGAAIFVDSRLARASKWKGMTDAEKRLAVQLQLEIQQNAGKVYGGIIHIPDMFSGAGSRIRFLPWKPRSS